MPIYVDWPQRIIHIARADMILIDPGPPKEIYQLDTDYFRLTLKDLEDEPEGMPFPDTHRHVTTTEVSGAVLARVVEIINNYQVEFEDGQYAVNLVGSNNNISDVAVVNQVSVRSSNSAGLQDLNSLQAASFDGAVSIKPSSPYSGTIFPVGTRGFPVNNLNDALAIASERGIRIIQVMESLSLNAADWSDGFIFRGDSTVGVLITIDPLAEVSNCEFQNCTIAGTLDGNNTLVSCDVHDINYVNGMVRDCALDGTITLGGGVKAQVINCWSAVPGGGPAQYPHINMGGTGNDLALRNYNGGLGIANCTGSTDASLDFGSGRVIIEDTVTDGTFYVRGMADVTNKSTGNATIVDYTINKSIDDIETSIGEVATAIVNIDNDIATISVDLGYIQADMSMTQKILRNKKISYKSGPNAGKMVIYDDNSTDILLITQIFEDDAATQIYRGQGIERSERLETP